MNTNIREEYKPRGPQDHLSEPRVPFTSQTDWKSVLSTRWTIQRVLNFTEQMRPGDVAQIKGAGEQYQLSAYDLRWTALRAHRSTPRAWIYFVFGFVAGVTTILADIFRATH